MKLIDEHHKNQHWQHTLAQGAKGLVLGLGVSAVFVSAFKRRYPVQYGLYTQTIKACMWTLPTLGLGAFWADEGSVKFSEMMHRSDYLTQTKREERERLAQLSVGDRLFLKASENRYKLIVGAWAASLAGAWSMVSGDRVMTTAQKAVQARMYAQAFTVLLLLSTIAMSVRERDLALPAPKPDWKRIIEDREGQRM